MAFNEIAAINQIALHERSIVGIKQSYDFNQNPDALRNLPEVMHLPVPFECSLLAHHNVWQNAFTIRSVLFVIPREAAGGKLRFIENVTMPFGNLWRAKFQDDTVIRDLLSTAQATRAFLKRGSYGAGGLELTFGATEYLGWVFDFSFVSA